MRDGFREISSGWMLVDDAPALCERIERLLEWAVDHAPLEPDELATVQFMLESALAWKLRDAGLGIPSL